MVDKRLPEMNNYSTHVDSPFQRYKNTGRNSFRNTLQIPLEPYKVTQKTKHNVDKLSIVEERQSEACKFTDVCQNEGYNNSSEVSRSTSEHEVADDSNDDHEVTSDTFNNEAPIDFNSGPVSLPSECYIFTVKIGWRDVLRMLVVVAGWIWKFLCLIRFLNPLHYLLERRRRAMVVDRDGKVLYKPSVWQWIGDLFRTGRSYITSTLIISKFLGKY